MMDVHTNQWIFNHVDLKTQNLFQARDTVKAFAELFIFQLIFSFFLIQFYLKESLRNSAFGMSLNNKVQLTFHFFLLFFRCSNN